MKGFFHFSHRRTGLKGDVLLEKREALVFQQENQERNNSRDNRNKNIYNSNNCIYNNGNSINNNKMICRTKTITTQPGAIEADGKCGKTGKISLLRR